jgi:hypothetical protein
VALPGSYWKGNSSACGFEEEVEGIDDRHLGHQIDLERNSRVFSGKTRRAR